MTYLKHEQKGRTKKAESAPEQEHKQPTPKRERTGGPSDYGRYYWCVKTELSDNGEIYVMADDARITADGCVLFVSKDEGEGTEKVRLALAAGKWTAVYAASCFDGSAVAVEHWKGECER